ncbi:MAG: sulfite exporter TauE/SafE family protein [Bacteroidota bacterium]
MTTQIVFIVLIIGLCAGMLSGLVGVGGGIILVPALVFFLGYNQHQAQGTSLGVLVFPVVILGFLKYATELKKTGDPVDFRIIGLLAIGFLIGGYFGGTLALKIDKELLKKIFAAILFYTAIKLLDWDKAVVSFFRSIF